MKFTYNYFTLLDDLHETMSVLMSLPVCVIIFNKKAEIIKINKAATDILRIENINDYTSGNHNLEISDHFHSITTDLQMGRPTISSKFEFKRPDSSSILVDLHASLFYDLKDLFVFQFSQIISEKPNTE